ncbi:hypothetical protein [Hyphomicrobium sp. ghe19]|uniref:hypothetical protein n=1 Tax=Hyphomicrobium sp. ghe19 TaxID=2682968 RepID=UPI0013677031|nr:hypothetical protein HYPP_02520 [Hyphomicrobium sp. ghe19]
MRPRKYNVPESVVRKARRYGVYGDTKARLSRMAFRSAPVTSNFGNRRFQSYVLLVENEDIKDVTRVAV